MRPGRRTAPLYDGRFSLRKLLTRNICHQAMFYRRDFIEGEIGSYSIEFPACADWDLNLRCRAKTRFHYLEIIIADLQNRRTIDGQCGRPGLSDGFIERRIGIPPHVAVASRSRSTAF